MVTSKFNVVGGGGGEENPAMDKHPNQGGLELPLVALCYRNWENLWPDWPLGWYMYVCKLVLIYGVTTIIHTVM